MSSRRPDYICPDCSAEMNRESEDDTEFYWCNNCRRSHEPTPVPAAKLAIMQDAARIADLERQLEAALEDNAAKVEAIAEARREWDSIITQNRAKDAEIARLRDALETARDSLMDIQDLSEPHKSYEGIGFQFDRIHTHATFGLSRSKDAAKLLEGKTL